MKKQRKGLGWYASAAALGLGMPVMMMGQAFAAAPTAKTYGTDAFDAKYSRGVVLRDSKFNATTNPMTINWPSGSEKVTIEVSDPNDNFDLQCYKNTTKSSYVEYKNGAIYNNEYYDVREYIWLGTASGANGAANWCYRGANSTTIYYLRSDDNNKKDNKTVANIEFHFYKAGTETEVEFHGVIGMNDFEVGDQYKISQGGGQVYLRKPTVLSYIEDSQAWGIPASSDKNSVDKQFDLWVEVDSTNSKPLTMQYIVDGPFSKVGRFRATAMMMEAVNLNYQIVGDKPDGVTAPASDVVTQYGNITPKNAKEAEGYTFDGWYYDKEMTNKAGTYMGKLDRDTTLYGKYVKVEEKEEEKKEDSPKTPDTGLFTGSDGFTKFGGVVAIAGSIAAGLTGYVVYKNRKHLLHKVKFSKKA